MSWKNWKVIYKPELPLLLVLPPLFSVAFCDIFRILAWSSAAKPLTGSEVVEFEKLGNGGGGGGGAPPVTNPPMGGGGGGGTGAFIGGAGGAGGAAGGGGGAGGPGIIAGGCGGAEVVL